MPPKRVWIGLTLCLAAPALLGSARPAVELSLQERTPQNPADSLESSLAAIRSGISVDLPLAVTSRTWTLRHADGAAIYVSLELPPHQSQTGSEEIQVSARCEIAAGDPRKTVSSFEESRSIQDSAPVQIVEWAQAPLGDYQVDCLVREDPGGRLGRTSITGSTGELAPRTEVTLSDVIMSQAVEKVEADRKDGPLAREGATLIPPARMVFDRSRPLLVYFEVYNLGRQPAPGSLFYDYRIYQAKALFFGAPLMPLELGEGADHVRQAFRLDLSSLRPGHYTLLLKVFHQAQGKATFKRVEFELD